MSEPLGSEGFARVSLGSLHSAFATAPRFRVDSRYGEDLAVIEPEPIVVASAEPASDPAADAYLQGYAQGVEDAGVRAAAAAQADAEAGEGLALAFARLDDVLEEQLRERLRDTVMALCEAALAPLAVDPEMLVRRVTAAAAMLARADDARVIRVHPEDLKLLAPRMCADWDVQPDPTLERGAIRVEGANGGVEDGPATWRHAIAEALHAC
jgi:flagellar assembly protein FliH